MYFTTKAPVNYFNRVSVGMPFLVVEWRPHGIIEYPGYPTHCSHLVFQGESMAFKSWSSASGEWNRSSTHPQLRPPWHLGSSIVIFPSCLFDDWEWCGDTGETQHSILPFFEVLLYCGPESHSSFPVERGRVLVCIRIPPSFFIRWIVLHFTPVIFSCSNSTLLHKAPVVWSQYIHTNFPGTEMPTYRAYQY